MAKNILDEDFIREPNLFQRILNHYHKPPYLVYQVLFVECILILNYIFHTLGIYWLAIFTAEMLIWVAIVSNHYSRIHRLFTAIMLLVLAILVATFQLMVLFIISSVLGKLLPPSLSSLTVFKYIFLFVVLPLIWGNSLRLSIIINTD